MPNSSCPSCGGQVPFASKVTVFAVCPYCSSAVVRDDVKLQHLGEMAALAEDYSVLQLQSMGVYEGKRFVIVGRVVYKWERGNWSEWFLFFPDGDRPNGGWLAEAQGFYAVSLEEPVPEFEGGPVQLSPGTQVEHEGVIYTVADIKEVTCAYSAGELPFVAQQGAKHTAVDLLGSNNWFGSIEYRESGVSFYCGKYLTFDELKLENVRTLDGWEL